MYFKLWQRSTYQLPKSNILNYYGIDTRIVEKRCIPKRWLKFIISESRELFELCINWMYENKL